MWIKLIRDLKTNWAQFLAVVIVVALGGSFFIASFSSYLNVADSLEQTYTELNFPLYWIKLDGEGPASLPPGAEMRETANAAVEMQHGERSGVRIIGLPPGGPNYNKLKLTSGAMPGDGQVLVENSFAKFYNLKLGDTMGVRVGDKVYNWIVSGTTGSPEYIFPVVERFVPNPSPRSFGVIYVPERQLVRDITGLNHEILVKGDIREVMTLLQSQGVKVREVYSRDEQPSHHILNLMITGFGKVVGVLPWLFLLAGGLASYALTSVLVRAQRNQIQVLRSLGLSNWQILVHFLAFGLLAGIAGSLLSTVLGIFLAERLTSALTGIIGLPFAVSKVRMDTLLTAGLFSCLAAVLGALSPALELRKQRQISPGSTARWQRFIPVLVRVPFNNLRRDKGSFLFGALVSGLGICLLVVGTLLYQSVWESGQRQFNRYQQYDLKVQFRTVLKEDVCSELAKLQGVTDVNPLYELPVIAELNKNQLPTLLVGTRGDMLRLEDRLGKGVQLGGLMLSEGIRNGLDARWAPKVNLLSLEGRKSEFRVKGYVRWHVGNQIFAPLEMVQSLAGKKGISGVYLRVNEGEIEQVRTRLYGYPTIIKVDSPAENLADQQTLMKFTYLYLGVLMLFGIILAATMLFATARVNTLSRSRDYLTMRVLGVGLPKVGLSVVIEYLMVLCGGLVVGITAGIVLTYYLLNRVNSLVFYNIFSLNPNTLLIIAAISVLIIPAAVISALFTVKKLNLAESTRENN